MRVTFKGSNSLLGVGSSFQALSYQATLADAERSYAGGVFTIVSHDVSMIDITTLVAFVGAGGEVEGFPVFVKLTTAQYAANVTAGIPNRLDGSSNPIAWSAWTDGNHDHYDADDGDKIVPGNAWGVELTGAEIKLLDDAGLDVLTVAEFQAALPDPPDAP